MKDNGHYVAYKPQNFQKKTLELIGIANSIIEEYEDRGMMITLRQLYYQFVARKVVFSDGEVFENVDKNYDRLGSAISNGRMAGLVSWTAIEDRGRNLMGLKNHISPSSAIKSLIGDYRIDLWADQPMRPEVWVEKAALEGVIGQACNKLRVDFFATRGYNSQSEQWRAGRRLARYISKGQTPIIFHLGDHDPSGIDMTRDNRDKLSLFAGVPINVQRIALNMPQIEQYNPPPNPAKENDSRYEEYRRQYGEESWELDALDPIVIHNLIEDAVLRVRDNKKWDEALRMEAEDKMVLQPFADEAEGENNADER